MAITVKPMNGLSALNLLEIPTVLLKTLAKNQIDVHLTSKQFGFAHPDGEFEFDIKLNDIQELAAGTMNPAKKQVLKQGLQSAIEEMLDALNIMPEVDFQHSTPGAAPAGTLGKLPPISLDAKNSLSAAAAAVNASLAADKVAWAPYPKSELSSGIQVPLRNAVRMYQPVQGTSPGSRYYLIAANNELRIAVRFPGGGKMSIRIEGPGYKTLKTKVTPLGFKTENEYASIHLEYGDDETLRNKTLGAILLGLGIKIETPFPDLDYLKGAKP